jgi:hypothetical protein
MDGLGTIGSDEGTALINTVPAAARRNVAPTGNGHPSRMPAGTGLEWVPKMIPRGVLGGLGQTDPTTNTAISLLSAVTRAVINGGVGAVVGVALAPDHDRRVKYGITGGLLGLFLGPLGIGGQALYVISKD